MAKTKSTPKQPEVYLRLVQQDKLRDGYGDHAHPWKSLCFCHLDERTHRPNSGHNEWWSDLGFYCQYEWADFDGKLKPFRTYGWDIEFQQVYSVDLRKAESMYKTLQRIAKIKWPMQPLSFGQFVVMVCAGLGVTRCVVDGGEESENACGYRYHVQDLSYAQRWIDGELERIRKALYPNGEPAAVAEVA